MYTIGEVIVYGSNGVCEIIDIAKKSFIPNQFNDYYVLKPINSQNNTIYAPVDNCNKLRYPLTKDEIDSIIKKCGETEVKAKTQFDGMDYSSILKSGDTESLVNLIRLLEASKEVIINSGKKFHIAEEHALKSAKKMVCDEFSYILKTDEQSVLKLILE